MTRPTERRTPPAERATLSPPPGSTDPVLPGRRSDTHGRGPGRAPIIAAALLLAGCGASSDVIRVDPADVDQVNARFVGSARIRYRSGATRVTDSLQLRDGQASWLDPGTRREMTTPIARIDGLQVRNRGAGVARGLAFGLAIGGLAGVVIEASSGDNDVSPDKETNRRAFAGTLLGAAGAAIGGILGGGIGVWEDRYVFDAADHDIPDGVSP